MSNDVTPQEECLDGETMAAWSEGSMRAAEAAAVERHVAGCARCRALMASFIRTTPPQPVAESLWRRWHLAWAVPLATAATAVAVWVALPNNDATPVAPAQEANAIARDALSTAPAVSPEASRQAAPAPEERERLVQRLDQKAKVAESANNEARDRSNAASSRALADEPVVPSAAPVPAPAAGAAAAPAAIAPVAPPPAAPAERAEADARKEVAANPALARVEARRQAFAPYQIASPDGSAHWRIVNGQQVERSPDGTIWTPATLNSPDRLIAGASASATVCWFVGARGAVYLTTDGTRFVRLAFTEMVDLTSVFASDALTATVSSADGRSWRTSDQGRTWLMVR
jgi:hypothetical protein